MKKEAKTHRVLANKCIAKCAQSANDCLREIIKIRKIIAEKQLKGLNTAESDKTKNIDSEESRKTKNV